MRLACAPQAPRWRPCAHVPAVSHTTTAVSPQGCASLHTCLETHENVGHIILTGFIASDYMSRTEKVIWLIVVWVLWGIGPLIYLLVGQRRNRLFGGHAVL